LKNGAAFAPFFVSDSNNSKFNPARGGIVAVTAAACLAGTLAPAESSL
jgi:hypothetical protein